MAIDDYDNDGHMDVAVAVDGGANILLHNNGDGTFTDVSSDTQVNDAGKAHSIALLDYDGNGLLDLLVTGYYSMGCSPTGANKLFRNEGGAADAPFTHQAGIGVEASKSESMAIGDYDGDGDVDVFLSQGMAGQCTRQRRLAEADRDKLLRNTAPGAAAKGLFVRPADAIASHFVTPGAVVTLYAAGTTTRVASRLVGGGNGFASGAHAGSWGVHFAVDPSTAYDVAVDRPSPNAHAVDWCRAVLPHLGLENNEAMNFK